MLSALIFALSRSRIAEQIATHAPGVRGFSRRFVAGRDQTDALAAVQRLNDAGFETTVSFLGEAVTSEHAVRAAIDEFTSFVAAAHARRLRSGISVKLTQLGLAFDRTLAERSLDDVLNCASAAGVFVRIDMEDSRYTAATLDIFRAARARHDNIGIVIQAYLRRSAADIDALAREGARVRLVKGAYREPPSIAFPSKREVDQSYARLIDAYFAAMPQSASPDSPSHPLVMVPDSSNPDPHPAAVASPVRRLAIATHDPRMQRAALRSVRAREVQEEMFEFQMLYGIRTDLQRALHDQGHRVRVYIPYGSHWCPYLMRRLAERPANLW
ncbi:MAG: proline dehydrogenase family protein, partial [Gemmatimonadaceae bacterium]